MTRYPRQTSSTAPPPAITQSVTDHLRNMLSASRVGDWSCVRAAILAGADADTRTGGSWTVLLRAIVEDQIDIVRLLLDRSADPNQTMPDGTTAISLAARERNLAAVNALLAHGAQHVTGALFVATRFRRVEVLERLLKAGADANARTREGNTALLLAAFDDNAATAATLIRWGADPLAPNAFGYSPVDIAESLGQTVFLAAMDRALAQPEAAVVRQRTLRILPPERSYRLLPRAVAVESRAHAASAWVRTPGVTETPVSVISTPPKPGVANADHAGQAAAHRLP